MDAFGAFGATQNRRWVVYLLAFVFVVAVLILLAGITLPAGVRSKLMGGPDMFQFWKNTELLPTLKVDYSEIAEKVGFGTYTMMVDVVFRNTRVSGSGSSKPHRHVLHRGSGEVEATRQLPGLQTSTVESTSVPLDIQLAAMPNGLPTRMNPGIFADPITNDLLIFVDTDKDNTAYRESLRIPDIPMDVPFNLAIVLNRQLLEVYVNCQLEVSKLLEGVPRATEKEWFGLAGAAPLAGQIQNLRLWPVALSPAQMKSECGRGIVFPTAKLASCQRL